MKRFRDKKEEAEKINVEAEESGEFSSDKPTVRKECAANEKRAKRKSTEIASKKLELELLAQRQHHFSDTKPHREKQQKLIAKNKELLENFEDEREKLNKAIKSKVIWSGFRGAKDLMPGIGWTTDFSKDWWDDYATKKFYSGGWICTKQLEGCKVSVLQDSHKGLEIGHKDSFYKHLSKASDPELVCDGNVHWQIYLVKKIQELNEVADNLEPQCHPCNMKQHNEESGGFEPQKIEDCSGEDCRCLEIENAGLDDSEEEL